MFDFVFHLTSFNCDSKGARDVGLTCKCHLSNIMPDKSSASTAYCGLEERAETYHFSISERA